MITVEKNQYRKNRWEIRIEGISHGYGKSKIEAQRAAVKKINSIISELEADRKRFTDEILAET